MPTYHKFHARPTDVDNIKFASRKEARYYKELILRQKAGEVLFFLRQTPIHLPGGVKYVCDFQVFLSDGTVQFVDVKGMETDIFKLKKKQVEELYPIQLTIV
jgi:hypothetical protein